MSDFGEALEARLRAKIRDVPDFPQEGIIFKDLMPVFGDGALFSTLCRALADHCVTLGVEAVAGIEARGFVLAAAVAALIERPVVLLRKPGKLPGATLRQTYALEYGEDALEVHSDAVSEGVRVILLDDVLATGGTMGAAIKLLGRLKADVVGAAVAVELEFLAGRERVEIPLQAAVRF